MSIELLLSFGPLRCQHAKQFFRHDKFCTPCLVRRKKGCVQLLRLQPEQDILSARLQGRSLQISTEVQEGRTA